MKILMVSNFFPPDTVGGAGIVALRQATALQRYGHTVSIFCGSISEEAPGFLTNESYSNLPVYRLRIRSLEKDLDFYWTVAAERFRSVVYFTRPDIVHFHNLSDPPPLKWSALRYGFRALEDRRYGKAA